MANERTPLRSDVQLSATQAQQRKIRLTGLIALGLVLVGVASWLLYDKLTSPPAVTRQATGKQTGVNPPEKGSDVTPQPPVDITKKSKNQIPKAIDPNGELFCGLTNHDAGYITLANRPDDHYFYWLFASRDTPETDPLVIWLTGGPGCSSMMALLTENGPCHVLPNLTTQINPYSWTNHANVLWLDQPSNVGYSYGTEIDHNETDVAENIYWFLQGFLDKHPEFNKRPLFLTGESYAGHYIPAAAHYIWIENLAHSEDDEDELGDGSIVNENSNASSQTRLNLQGIAIGNGLVNPVIQLAHILDMVDNSYNITLMNDTQLVEAKSYISICTQLLDECQRLPATCIEAIVYCQEHVMNTLSDRNPYDIRKECHLEDGDTTKCYDMTYVTEYLNSEPVRKYLNVSEDHVKQWTECSPQVGLAFASDIGKRFDPYVADLLNDGSIRVLIYNGDADWMCNWYGAEAWTNALEWDHQQEFNRVEERPFTISLNDTNKAVGSVRAYETLFTFLRVYNSGHMVPMDQPEVALKMFNRFLRNETF